MQHKIRKILDTYGVEMVLKDEIISMTFHGFFQPVRSKSWQYMEGNYSPLGEIPRGQYVYLGPVSPEAKAGDTLTVGQSTYWLRRTELIRDKDGPVYCWGLCVEKGGEDTWGRS